MEPIRVRLQNGMFIPLDDISGLTDGAEYEVSQPRQEATREAAASLARLRAAIAKAQAEVEPLPEPTPEDYEALKASLAKSAGIYADDPFDSEAFYAERKAQQLEETRRRWHSSL